MQFSFITATALIASLMGTVLAQGPPANCVQTATSGVGFCICTTTTAVPTTTTVSQTLTITTVVPTVTTTTVVKVISAELRGAVCYPSSPYSPPSPYQSPSFPSRRRGNQAFKA